jgi:hypothetical protein
MSRVITDDACKNLDRLASKVPTVRAPAKIHPVKPSSIEQSLPFTHPSIKVPPIKTLAKLKKKESRLGVSPGGPDIAAWISLSSHSEMLEDMSEGDGPAFVWRRDMATGEWTEVLGYASKRLLTSRTGGRVPFLRDDLLALVKTEGTWTSR